MQKVFELIVFDWDGTLMDSEAHIVASMERALEDLALPALPKENIRNIIGLGLFEALSQLMPSQSQAPGKGAMVWTASSTARVSVNILWKPGAPMKPAPSRTRKCCTKLWKP